MKLWILIYFLATNYAMAVGDTLLPKCKNLKNNSFNGSTNIKLWLDDLVDEIEITYPGKKKLQPVTQYPIVEQKMTIDGDSITVIAYNTPDESKTLKKVFKKNKGKISPDFFQYPDGKWYFTDKNNNILAITNIRDTGFVDHYFNKDLASENILKYSLALPMSVMQKNFNIDDFTLYCSDDKCGKNTYMKDLGFDLSKENKIQHFGLFMYKSYIKEQTLEDQL